jgi:hypothetical protein
MSEASFCKFCQILGFSEIDDMRRGVDLMGRAEPVGERLQLLAVAGGKPQVATFLGEGFGGGSTYALGGACDQDALAAQMQIHGNSRFMRGKGTLGEEKNW